MPCLVRNIAGAVRALPRRWALAPSMAAQRRRPETAQDGLRLVGLEEAARRQRWRHLTRSIAPRRPRGNYGHLWATSS
eukprot:CAMPEP_0175608334 /NCGR_PEP_ID=MMETSP0096-20121207/61689_1 /TAXON_ID=311494 /ORGANISM="Alexandrium monilatum, Strain CCMP3105" /LENGTH=77 /DNA_ID=CAMNT_0016913215 /DNA_START=31 /DNA_END=260 /DNA_ORIENTATION=+